MVRQGQEQREEISTREKACAARWSHAIEATCRRKAVEGDEPREGDEPLSAAAKRKSSVESERLGKRRDDVRTKYCELDIRF